MNMRLLFVLTDLVKEVSMSKMFSHIRARFCISVTFQRLENNMNKKSSFVVVVAAIEGLLGSYEKRLSRFMDISCAPQLPLEEHHPWKKE